MKESKNFLAIYAIVIIILLALIMFVLPDSFFSRKYEQNTEQFQNALKQEQEKQEAYEAEKKKEFVDFEEQKNQILNGNLEYKYLLIDAMGTEQYTYDCTGKKNGQIESGNCTLPESFSYTEQNKLDQFKNKIDPTYIEAQNIFNLIKDVEPTKEEHNVYREFTYTTQIKDLETTIIIQTTKDYISQIKLLNPYMTYMINYSNVNIDN